MQSLSVQLRRLGLALCGVAALSCVLAGEAPGITQAVREAQLSMPVAGRVEDLQVREGSVVKSGQVLLHLDRQLEALEVQRRQLQLKDQVHLRDLRQREHTLREQVAALHALAQTGGVARKQWQDESLALQTVVAERDALLEAKKREEVELALAQEAYERRHLRAPISGVVTQMNVRLGESVVPHSPLLTLVDVSRVRFRGTVPAVEARQLRAGAQVSVEIRAGDQWLKRVAQLVFVSPVADASSGLLEVIAEFDNRDGSIRPGVSGRMLY